MKAIIVKWYDDFGIQKSFAQICEDNEVEKTIAEVKADMRRGAFEIADIEVMNAYKD